MMLLMMNNLSHYIDDHIHFLQVQAMQNNIKVIVSECHLSILERAIAHFLIRKYIFAIHKMMTCMLKTFTSLGYLMGGAYNQTTHKTN